ncbi:hypothetical protein [Methanopyrus sp.]
MESRKVEVVLEFGCEFGARLWVIQQVVCIFVSSLVILILIYHTIRAVRRHDLDCALASFGMLLLILAAGVITPLNTLLHLYYHPRIKWCIILWTYIGSLGVGMVTFGIGIFNVLTRRSAAPFGGEGS